MPSNPTAQREFNENRQTFYADGKNFFTVLWKCMSFDLFDFPVNSFVQSTVAEEKYINLLCQNVIFHVTKNREKKRNAENKLNLSFSSQMIMI